MAWRSCGLAGSSPASRICSSGNIAFAHAPDQPGETGGDVLLEAHGLADFPDRHARTVVDDGAADRGALARVALVEILDDLFAALMLEIDVDVGRLAALGRDEALEQHIDAGRIDGGDAKAEAHRAVGGRAAALAQDVASRVAKRTMS